MGSLRAVDELKEENELVDQVRRIQKFESALQKGHPDFVHLSQLAVELIGKLDNSNGADVNQIRQQIETITQRWDNIVARIDEHSHMVRFTFSISVEFLTLSYCQNYATL